MGSQEYGRYLTQGGVEEHDATCLRDIHQWTPIHNQELRKMTLNDYASLYLITTHCTQKKQSPITTKKLRHNGPKSTLLKTQAPNH